MDKYLSLILLLVLSGGCAGYRFQSKNNPFAQYGIKSISVPMFYNKSNFADVTGPFTKEIYKTLLEFKNLKLSTTPENADAVLIGIVESRAKKKESIIVRNRRRAEAVFGTDSLGDERQDFLVPSVNQIGLRLRIIVIKHPTPTEIKFFQTQFSKNAISSKVIFNETFALNRSYNLKELRGDAIDVLGTQNRGVEKQQILFMAEGAAQSFKDMILYAF